MTEFEEKQQYLVKKDNATLNWNYKVLGLHVDQKINANLSFYCKRFSEN